MSFTFILPFVGMTIQESPDVTLREIESEVVAQVNELRRKRGVALVWDNPELSVGDEILLSNCDRNVASALLDVQELIADPLTSSISVSASLSQGKPNLRILLSKQPTAPRLILAHDRRITYQREVRVDLVLPRKAKSIRISEDSNNLGSWKPFRDGGSYTLKKDSGVCKVYADIQDETGTITHVEDSIELVTSAMWPMPGETANVLLAPDIPDLREVSPGNWTYPLVFPILGGVKWTDTWGAPRGGGTRRHEGQDLMAAKMRFVLAASDGVFYGSNILDKNGVSTSYLHLNNDSPGTDDGKGGDTYYYAPGVYSGTKVVAGQHVGYVGDSGNAEDTAPHLHFELHLAGLGVVNAATSLVNATVLHTPKYVFERPDYMPRNLETRWDAQIQEISVDGKSIKVSIAATINRQGKIDISRSLTEKWIDVSNLWLPLRVRDFYAIVGNEHGSQGALKVSRMACLRKPKQSP